MSHSAYLLCLWGYFVDLLDLDLFGDLFILFSLLDLAILLVFDLSSLSLLETLSDLSAADLLAADLFADSSDLDHDAPSALHSSALASLCTSCCHSLVVSSVALHLASAGSHTSFVCRIH